MPILYFHFDNEVEVSEDSGIWNLKNHEAVLRLYSQKLLSMEEGMISKKYNELDMAPLLIKTSVMEDRMTDCSIFASEDISVTRAKVYQVGKEVEVPEEFVTAWDVIIAGQRKWTLMIWNRETYRGGKMYLCHGVPVYGKAVALCWEDSGVRRIRLKV